MAVRAGRGSPLKHERATLRDYNWAAAEARA